MGWFAKKKHRAVTISPETVPNRLLDYDAANIQGVGSRTEQQDAFAVVNALDAARYNSAGLMLAVCDGMGGMTNGCLAADTAIKSLRSSFQKMDLTASPEMQLRAFIQKASDEVGKLTGGAGGSTAVVCAILHEQLWFVSVGDSALYLYRSGMLYRLNAVQNLCHTLYLEQIRNRSFSPDICRSDPEAAVLTNFLGMLHPETPDGNRRPLQLMRSDVLLVCSDGVSGVLTEDEIISALSQKHAAAMGEALENSIIKKEHPNQDNYTAVILKCL